MSTRPLDGVVILDLSMFVSGPFGTTLLSDLGARVVKVEPLGGDPVRSNGVGPSVAGENAQFITFNHGKESLAVDLKSDAGAALFRRLAAKADVVFDNFRPGVRARLGIDFASLSSLNPRLITCSISGYGQDGDAGPAFDLIVQALSGVMSITGSAALGPARVGFQIGDLAGGLYAAIGVLAALHRRNQTGLGSEVDVSLLDTQLALLGDDVTYRYLNAANPVAWGTGHPYLVPYQAFATKDHPLVVAAVGQEAFWERFCVAIEKEGLAADPRFATNNLRVRNRDELIPIIEGALLDEGREHWLAALRAHDVPSAPLLGVGEALDLDSVKTRGMVRPVSGYEDDVRVPGSPVKFSGVEVDASASPAPRLGDHTQNILASLGEYSADDVRQLLLDRVISGQSPDNENNAKEH